MPARAGGSNRILILVALVALVTAACGEFTPTTESDSPTDFGGIVAELQIVGISVDRVVSGDAGCNDQRLAHTAIGFDAVGIDQTTTVRIYLYAFKDQATYDALRASVDACARSYVVDPAAFGSVDVPPYVLAGNGPWGPAFKVALRTALQRAAVGG